MVIKQTHNCKQLVASLQLSPISQVVVRYGDIMETRSKDAKWETNISVRLMEKILNRLESNDQIIIHLLHQIASAPRMPLFLHSS